MNPGNYQRAYTLPQFDVSASEVEGCLDILRALHAALRECFGRSELWDHCFRYLVGQLSMLARQSIEPIALQVDASSVRAMQRGISDVPQDEPRMLEIYPHVVADSMGEPDGVLMIDETGFMKKRVGLRGHRVASGATRASTTLLPSPKDVPLGFESRQRLG